MMNLKKSKNGFRKDNGNYKEWLLAVFCLGIFFGWFSFIFITNIFF
ncbi:MAG: hypothetical protein IIZ78_23030 [Clostridiales bacterium]|nr:hypothetical protein [Clostridiales bacterium]